MATRKKLAIVSSYNEACGNASYTHVLKNAFNEHVDTDVIALDLFLLQKRGRVFRDAGDRHIKQIAEKLKTYDYVNIQFEAGLYGLSEKDSLRRIKILINASPSLILTMHRFDPPSLTRFEIIFRAIKRGSFPALVQGFVSQRWAAFYQRVVLACEERGKRANVWIAVHTRRERRMIQEVVGFQKVFDFPITFLRPSERSELLDTDRTAEFRRRYNIADGVKVVGAFGFVSEYKGYETLIRALAILPENYQLFIFGGQHPGSITTNVPVDPYIKKLIDEVQGETKTYIKDQTRRISPFVKSAKDLSAFRDLFKFNLMDRVRFCGSLPDPEFLEALRHCDAVALPYLEVGQSMSGVIALSIECGANLYCSNNHSFNEVRKYMGDVYHRFDVGNYVELAQKLTGPANDFRVERDAAFLKYNISTNVDLHLEKLGFDFPESETVATPKILEGHAVKTVSAA
jgi:glycosyltransferase involved in cell wall biosynthesis